MSSGSSEKTGKLVFRYMMPVGTKEYPIEVEIRFPHNLSDAVGTELKRMFWPLMPVVEKVNFPREPEMEVQIEEEAEKEDVEVVPVPAPRKTTTATRARRKR